MTEYSWWVAALYPVFFGVLAFALLLRMVRWVRGLFVAGGVQVGDTDA